MPPTTFSGWEVVKALTRHNFAIIDRTGSHVKLRYDHPTNEDDVRIVSVPMHDELDTGTLRSIAEQSGANDFRAWRRWIDENS